MHRLHAGFTSQHQVRTRRRQLYLQLVLLLKNANGEARLHVGQVQRLFVSREERANQERRNGQMHIL